MSKNELLSSHLGYDYFFHPLLGPKALVSYWCRLSHSTWDSRGCSRSCIRRCPDSSPCSRPHCHHASQFLLICSAPQSFRGKVIPAEGQQGWERGQDSGEYVRGSPRVRSRKIKRNSHTVLMAGSEGGKASLQAKSWFVWMGTEDSRRLLFLKGILEFQF